MNHWARNTRLKKFPPNLLDLAKEYREKMLESVAEHDEQVLEKYLNGDALSEAEVKKAIRAGAISMKITPSPLRIGILQE